MWSISGVWNKFSGSRQTRSCKKNSIKLKKKEYILFSNSIIYEIFASYTLICVCTESQYNTF